MGSGWHATHIIDGILVNGLIRVICQGLGIVLREVKVLRDKPKSLGMMNPAKAGRWEDGDRSESLQVILTEEASRMLSMLWLDC